MDQRAKYLPNRIDEIQRLKDQGMSMAEIVARYAAQGLSDADSDGPAGATTQLAPQAPPSPAGAPGPAALRVTLAELAGPFAATLAGRSLDL